MPKVSQRNKPIIIASPNPNKNQVVNKTIISRQRTIKQSNIVTANPNNTLRNIDLPMNFAQYKSGQYDMRQLFEYRSRISYMVHCKYDLTVDKNHMASTLTRGHQTEYTLPRGTQLIFVKEMLISYSIYQNHKWCKLTKPTYVFLSPHGLVIPRFDDLIITKI